ncbi:MAG: hypothetical protein IAC13_08585, partial [Firmicutes bacterium]|nr:hypothetical protein [Candidatus Scybalomonas excrementavium]
MKKEIFLKNLLPIVLIFIMGGVFVISSKVYYRQTMIEQISNDLYKKDVTHCMQKGKIQLSQMIDICDNTFLSKILDEKGMYNNVRGIYFSSNYSYCLPVI